MTLLLSAVIAAGLASCAAWLWFERARRRRAVRAEQAADAQAAGSCSSELGFLRTQELVRIAGFDGPALVTTDGARVVYVHVDGRNLGFLTPEQKDRDAMALGVALAAYRRAYKIHRCQRPVDAQAAAMALEVQLAEIEQEARELRAGRTQLRGFAAEKRLSALDARRRLIEGVYKPRTSANEETKYETDVFVTLAFSPDEATSAEAEREAASFCRLLAGAGYAARVMRPYEVIEREMNYFGRFPAKGEGRDPYATHEVKEDAR